MKTLGQLAYEAFAEAECLVKGWNDLDPSTTAAWETMVRKLIGEIFTVDTAVQVLVNACHGAASKAGWWADAKTGIDVRDNPLCFSNKLALIHSEISEALEGDRKNKMDEHLPHFPSRDVELADALIRICDTAGGFGLLLSQATVQKLDYNAKRADHKIENRQQEGGKAY